MADTAAEGNAGSSSSSTTATTMRPSSSAANAAAVRKNAVDMREVQETVSRLAAHKGVTAVLILNSAGDIVTQSSSGSGGSEGGGGGGVGNAKLLAKMLQAANMYVASMPSHRKDNEDDTNDDEGDDGPKSGEGAGGGGEEDISFVRVRTKRDEILIAPKLGFTLVVVQDPSVSTL